MTSAPCLRTAQQRTIGAVVALALAGAGYASGAASALTEAALPAGHHLLDQAGFTYDEAHEATHANHHLR